ncbi:hypothetical protein [Deinococcus yavapaiensis]|uniref:Uncharacterized protein n=1 Tax=Deinococcus yavapaiensis KR-236 TaxID=694435 RepID=A0A318SF32_9DEIO|nr:hypothetical protein [Deinococcus yavapaiensis]PYE55312.1 hypothetical protein DES52_103145 [Deinococcus yavapaiensis KR-236]
MQRKTFLSATAALSFALLGGALAASPVTVTATSSAYKVPAQVSAGYVRFELKNTDKTPHDLQIFKLNAGVGKAALVKAISDFAMNGDAAAEPLMKAASFFGGVMSVDPGKSGSVGVTLEPGTYAVSSLSMNGDEKNPKALAAQGFLEVFTVVKGASADAAPKTDYQVGLADFAVALPATQIKAGAQTWNVTNQGTQPHFLLVARLQPGKTQDDVMRFLMAPPEQQTGAPPLDMLGDQGAQVLSPGKSNVVTMNLAPGTYFLACFIGDPKTQMPHAMLGMTQFFTVK